VVFPHPKNKTGVPMSKTIMMCSFVVLFFISVSQSAEVALPKKNFNPLALEEMMLGFIAENNLPGASVPAAPNSLYRIASISKPITSIAIMQLVEKKKLNLTDKVTDIIKFDPFLEGDAKPDLRWKEITIAQLLSHTGGFDRAKSFDAMFKSVQIAKAFNKPAPASKEDVIRYMMGKKLDFNPGERFAYSNLGYCLLGRIIEKVSNQTYNDYVTENIFKPLGIDEIKPGKSLASNRYPNEVVYYPPSPSKANSVFPPYESVDIAYGTHDHESLDAVGGWIASARSLVQLASSLDDDALTRVLGKEATKVMFSNPKLHKEEKPAPTFYALGWNVRPVENTLKANTWHNGALSGTSTLLVRRHDGYTWAVLFNGSKPSGKDKPTSPSGAIDSLMHKAVDSAEVPAKDETFSKPSRLKRLRPFKD
jgi:N-acyl-D-amino-acid deacylase